MFLVSLFFVFDSSVNIIIENHSCLIPELSSLVFLPAAAIDAPAAAAVLLLLLLLSVSPGSHLDRGGSEATAAAVGSHTVVE